MLTFHKLLSISFLLLVVDATLPPVCTSCFVEREGQQLYELQNDGEKRQEFTFSGLNIFWLGQDHSDTQVPGGDDMIYNYPSQFRIDDVLESARSMGAQVVRSHTLGISTGTGEFHNYNMGWEGTVWPSLGAEVGVDSFSSMDYAMYRAAALGIRLVVPLTGEWNYFHGGIHDFLGWRGKSQLEGVEDNCVCNMDQHQQDEFYTDPDVVSDFKQYVSLILNHVNNFTGIAYKDDPTILAWESGDELYYPTLQWTVDLAKYIKDDLGAKQLFMDGRLISETGFYPEFEDAAAKAEYIDNVDIVSDHYYPMDLDKLMEMSSLVNVELGLPYVIGEIGWVNGEVDVLTFLSGVEQLASVGLVSGSLFWSMFGHAEQYGHVTPDDDEYSIYWPSGPEPSSFNHNNVAYRNLMRNFSDHMFVMSQREIPESYELSSSSPVISFLECKVGEWVRVAFRGVAGAHLYKVTVDGVALSFIEDRQKSPTYIHNQVVKEGSVVQVIPYGYGEIIVEGTPSDTLPCVF